MNMNSMNMNNMNVKENLLETINKIKNELVIARDELAKGFALSSSFYLQRAKDIFSNLDLSEEISNLNDCHKRCLIKLERFVHAAYISISSCSEKGSMEDMIYGASLIGSAFSICRILQEELEDM